LIEKYISPPQDDSITNDIGWEETTYIAITTLLKTSLAKNQKEASAIVSQLKPLSDVSKLKKHISIGVDRLLK